ncbi:hypothetical protein BFP76_00380 [Amylibacter kogurei]|uniref:Tellurium resistance protein n=1 Tax=Paramylibacter kogurei TaxID=1889778 RepID=A0A2G5K9R7_9RHOB|nr:TrgA family protein [Amylibacter kogurei]PIB25630.1 hypothetical protein BFP76_00380 [Amylibacter kogurei]
MPTGAKLVAAITLMIVAYIASAVFMQSRVTELNLMSSLLTGSAVIGFVTGWIVLGNEPGYGGIDSIAAGWRAIIVGVVVACFVYGLVVVTGTMADGGFSEPLNAVIAWIRISLTMMLRSFDPFVWVILFLGGAIAGRLTGIANKRWI